MLRQGASRWGQTQLGVLALEVLLTHLLVVLLGALSFRAILTYSLRVLKKKVLNVTALSWQRFCRKIFIKMLQYDPKLVPAL